MTPHGSNLLVTLDEIPTMAGDIHLPPSSESKTLRALHGTIQRIGIDTADSRMNTLLKPGAKVWFLRLDSTPIQDEGKEVWVVPRSAILAIG